MADVAHSVARCATIPGHDDRCDCRRHPRPDRRRAGRRALDLEQLQQLVGLVEYDASRRPVPGDRLGRGGLRGRQRHPDRALLPVRVRHGARRLLRPRDRQPRPQGVRAQERLVPVRRSRAASRRTARCSTTTARTATASSTSPSRCPTSTGASRTPARTGATRRAGAARRHRRARHRADRGHRGVRRHRATRWSTAPATTGPTCPATSRARSGFVKRDGRPEAAVPGPRPRRRQRRARPDGRVGRLLQQGHGLREHGGVHRRRHRHRLLGADVARSSPTATTG